MKRFARPIRVTTRDHVPVSFHWRGRDYHVLERVDHWRIQTRWWEEHEEQREYYQVLARVTDADPRPEAEGVYELYRRNGKWFMGRIVD